MGEPSKKKESSTKIKLTVTKTAGTTIAHQRFQIHFLDSVTVDMVRPVLVCAYPFPISEFSEVAR